MGELGGVVNERRAIMNHKMVEWNLRVGGVRHNWLSGLGRK